MPACLRDRVDGALVVAAEHDDFADARSVQRGNCVGGVGAHGVADGENAEHFAFAIGVRLVADDDDGLRSALRFPRAAARFPPSKRPARA